jgi:DNA-binding response OmpR family regulator
MKRILIVDDEPDILKSVSFRIKKAGYDVIEATDGKMGFDKARSEMPDLIVLDWRLPLMDGGEVYKALKADDKTKDIPVVILTASRETEGLQIKLDAMGIEHVLIKPYEPSELLAKIKGLVGE